MGVSGYGNDQSFLHFKNYQENKKNTKIAIFCFNSGNELRNINVQRSFLNKSGDFIYLKSFLPSSNIPQQLAFTNDLILLDCCSCNTSNSVNP